MRVAAAPGKLDLLVLGDLNPDLILAGEEAVPVFGQVERLIASAELTIGGSGAIVACGAARLGLRTAVAGVIGDDLFGHFMLEALSKCGVDVGPAVVEPDAATGLTVILSRPEDRAILTYPGAIAALSADHLGSELMRSARHLHVSSFFLQSALVPGLREVFEQAAAAGASISVDPNWDPSGQWDGGLRRLLGSIDVLLPNAEEVVRIAREPDPEAAARALAAEGPLVAVKLGREGALAARGEEVIRVPVPLAVEPIDAIGAGDSFDAGLIAGLLAGWHLERALSMGCACGALSTLAPGGTAAQPTLAQALEFLDRGATTSSPQR